MVAQSVIHLALSVLYHPLSIHICSSHVHTHIKMLILIKAGEKSSTFSSSFFIVAVKHYFWQKILCVLAKGQVNFQCRSKNYHKPTAHWHVPSCKIRFHQGKPNMRFSVSARCCSCSPKRADCGGFKHLGSSCLSQCGNVFSPAMNLNMHKEARCFSSVSFPMHSI